MSRAEASSRGIAGCRVGLGCSVRRHLSLYFVCIYGCGIQRLTSDDILQELSILFLRQGFSSKIWGSPVD